MGRELFLRLIHPDLSSAMHPLHIDEAALSAAKREAVGHNLLMLMYAQLETYERCVGHPLIKRFLADLTPLYLHSVARSAHMENTQKLIISTLKQNDVKAIIIKGTAIARYIYENENCRVSSDIDVLIQSRDILRANLVLCEAGYVRVQKFPLAYAVEKFRHLSYQHVDKGTFLEIHWNFGFPGFFRLSSEDIWRQVVESGGSTKLSPEMATVHLLINHHVHAFRQLKTLVDILWSLFRYRDEIEWDLFVQELKRVGLLRTTQIVLAQTLHLWKEYENAPVVALKREILRTGIKGTRVLHFYFCKEIGRKKAPTLRDKMMARFALDKASRVLRSCLTTLVPVPRAVKGLYNDRRNWVLPVNYCRFIAWRIKSWLAIGSAAM